MTRVDLPNLGFNSWLNCIHHDHDTCRCLSHDLGSQNTDTEVRMTTLDADNATYTKPWLFSHLALTVTADGQRRGFPSSEARAAQLPLSLSLFLSSSTDDVVTGRFQLGAILWSA